MNARDKVIEWIGSDGNVEAMSDKKAEALLDWLEENNFSVETDMEKLEEFFPKVAPTEEEIQAYKDKWATV